MTDKHNHRKRKPMPRKPGDAVILILIAILTAWLIGYGALYTAGLIEPTPPPAQYEGGGDNWDERNDGGD